MFPCGTGSPNSGDVQYYHSIIDELTKEGIQPVVVLYQSELPQALLDLGGWSHPNSSDWFKNYADFCFQMFGNKVLN